MQNASYPSNSMLRGSLMLISKHVLSSADRSSPAEVSPLHHFYSPAFRAATSSKSSSKSSPSSSTSRFGCCPQLQASSRFLAPSPLLNLLLLVAYGRRSEQIAVLGAQTLGGKRLDCGCEGEGMVQKSAAEGPSERESGKEALASLSSALSGREPNLPVRKKGIVYFLPFFALFCGPLVTRERGQRLLRERYRRDPLTGEEESPVVRRCPW